MKHTILFITAIFFYSILNGQTRISNTSAGMTIALPLISNGSFYDYSNQKNNKSTGFLGIGFSLFYKKNQNKFSLSYEQPIIKFILSSPKGGYSSISTNLFEATIHHHLFDRVNAIAGLNYTNYHFHTYTDLPGVSDIDKKDAAMGLTLGVEILETKSASVIVTYRPSLYSFDNKDYRYIISLGIRFDINFWKK